MKKILFSLTIAVFLISCNSNPEKDRITELLKEKIGSELPFNEIQIGTIENGTAVIVDGSWCYWINKDNKIYCVNGASKSVYNVNNPECEDAPINSTFFYKFATIDNQNRK